MLNMKTLDIVSHKDNAKTVNKKTLKNVCQIEIIVNAIHVHETKQKLSQFWSTLQGCRS